MEINHKGATVNSLMISKMSLMILSCMHVLCRQAHVVKQGTFLHPQNMRMIIPENRMTEQSAELLSKNIARIARRHLDGHVLFIT